MLQRVGRVTHHDGLGGELPLAKHLGHAVICDVDHHCLAAVLGCRLPRLCLPCQRPQGPIVHTCLPSASYPAAGGSSVLAQADGMRIGSAARLQMKSNRTSSPTKVHSLSKFTIGLWYLLVRLL